MDGEAIVFQLKADIFKALATPLRLAVIESLKNGEKSVGQLVTELGIEQSSLSKNLATLRQAGILKSRPEKGAVYYSIQDKSVFQILSVVSEMLGKRLQESQKALDHLGLK